MILFEKKQYSVHRDLPPICLNDWRQKKTPPLSPEAVPKRQGRKGTELVVYSWRCQDTIKVDKGCET